MPNLPSWVEPVLRPFQALGDFVYPPSCAWCHEAQVCDSGARPPQGVCSVCLEFLAPTVANSCRRCGAAVGPYAADESGCQHCRDEKYAFDNAVSLGTYQGELRQAILDCKQHGREPLARALCAELVGRHGARLQTPRPDLIVPVPHFWAERIFRGALLPAIMTDSLSQFLMVRRSHHILVKRRRTKSQVDLTPTDRRRNLQKAFRIAGRARLTGLSVLLVDDVLTTGTTAHRAAQVLKQAGAETVAVAVLARALGERHLDVT